MEKIYGYKEKDIVALAEFIKDKGETSLSNAFEKFGILNGKAKGTVRNLYYALAKRSNEDKEFCQRYLSGKPIKISKIVEFTKQDEKELIKNIILQKNLGKSVRSIIMEMAKGDAKIALRYQNKYRNAIKNNPQLIEKIVGEINNQGNLVIEIEKEPKNIISDIQFAKLKNEIDALVQKISSKIKRENQYLKERVARLESENLKLVSILYGDQYPTDARKFFSALKPKEFMH